MFKKDITEWKNKPTNPIFAPLLNLPPHSAIFSKASSIMNVAVNTRGVFSVTAFGVQKVNAETSFKINLYPEIRHSLLK